MSEKTKKLYSDGTFRNVEKLLAESLNIFQLLKGFERVASDMPINAA